MGKDQSSLMLIFVALLFLGGAYALPRQQDNDQDVIKITARMFEYTPSRIELKKGVPVILELTSLDRMHGFNVPDLGLRADVLPGQSVQVRLLPEKIGTYLFFCDIFCGDGHDEMTGMIIVND